MSDTAWGLAETRPASPARPAERPAARRSGAQSAATGAAPRAREARKASAGPTRLSPQVAASAHNGIVWLHLSAIAIWLVIGAVFGAVAASGRDLPVVVFVATLGAAAGTPSSWRCTLSSPAAARRRQATSLSA